MDKSYGGLQAREFQQYKISGGILLMNAEKKLYNSLIQLDNGSNYEIVENMETIKLLLTDDFIMGNTFITFHFPDGLECMIKKSKIVAFYENSE